MNIIYWVYSGPINPVIVKKCQKKTPPNVIVGSNFSALFRVFPRQQTLSPVMTPWSNGGEEALNWVGAPQKHPPHHKQSLLNEGKVKVRSCMWNMKRSPLGPGYWDLSSSRLHERWGKSLFPSPRRRAGELSAQRICCGDLQKLITHDRSHSWWALSRYGF